jgi:hypothetical protein
VLTFQGFEFNNMVESTSAATVAASRKRRRKAPWIVLGFIASGCVLDKDDMCGPNQVIFGDDERCVCADGYAYTPTGCVACGENEVSSANGCACAPGYGRADAAEACEPIPEGVGTPCTVDADCLNATYSHCQISPIGEGYCTSQNCTTDADCDGGYQCVLGETPSYCRRKPVGAGVACTGPTDMSCVGTEAPFCDFFVSSSCLEQDCTKSPDSCFTGTKCCDLAAFGLPKLCIAEAAECME